MRKLIALGVVGVSLLLTGTVSAQETYRIRLTNLTRGQIMSPAVIAAHSSQIRMFRVGRQASPALAALAEDADTSALTAALDAAGADVTDYVVGDGVLMPGETKTYEITIAAGDYLSLASMLVTSNDAFAGVDSYDLSGLMGRKSFTVPAYDSGSENNSENCAYIPGPPCGNGGARDTKGREGFVHIHAGIRGDGDISKTNYDWRNPVMRVELLPGK